MAENPRNRGVNQRGEAGADQLKSNLDGAGAVTSPAHSNRPRMVEKQPVEDSAPTVAKILLLHRRHGLRLSI
jgi:hypothetical protein